MTAVLINAGAVMIGGLLGLSLKGRITKDSEETVSTAVGLVTLVLGMDMALSGGTLLIVIPALVLGGLMGTALGVERGILKAGDSLRRIVSPGDEGGAFARGFLDATVLFCVGPMTVVGSIEAGLKGNYDVIFTKTAMDASIAVIMAAGLGAGVAASAISILVVQGAITLAADALSPVVTDGVLEEIGSLGGYLVLMISLNLLNVKRVKTGNYLPAIPLIVLFRWGRDVMGLQPGV